MISFFQKKRRVVLIFIGISGVTGIIFLFKNYAFNRVLERRPVKTFSSFSQMPSSPPSWKRYLKIGKDFERLEQKWTAGDNAPELASDNKTGNNGDNLDLEAIDNQSNQIERISMDEEKFKLLMLNSSVKTLEKELTEEKERRLSEKTSALNQAYELLIKNKEKEIADIYKSYERELRDNYRNKLSNLQLQLSVADLIDDKIKQTERKQQLQAEIELIHEDIDGKLKLKKQQLDADLQAFKSSNAGKNDTELYKFKKELNANFDSELANYKKQMNEEYQTWHQNRETEVANALALRQEQKKLYQVTATVTATP